MGGQSDIALFRFGDKSGITACVKAVEVIGGGIAVADMVQDIDEVGILLAIDMGELDGDIGHLPQRLTAKEIGSVVIFPQHLLVLRCDDRCELLQVAYHEQLHAAERLCGVAVAAQHGVDGIEEVGADHGNLVDDDHVK